MAEADFGGVLRVSVHLDAVAGHFRDTDNDWTTDCLEGAVQIRDEVEQMLGRNPDDLIDTLDNQHALALFDGGYSFFRGDNSGNRTITAARVRHLDQSERWRTELAELATSRPELDIPEYDELPIHEEDCDLIEGNIYRRLFWAILDRSMQERGITAFGYIQCFPRGPFWDDYNTPNHYPLYFDILAQSYRRLDENGVIAGQLPKKIFDDPTYGVAAREFFYALADTPGLEVTFNFDEVEDPCEYNFSIRRTPNAPEDLEDVLHPVLVDLGIVVAIET